MGQTIEAQIESIGRDKKARLLVAGMTLDVDLPIDLVAGTTIKLLVKNSSDGSLTFELKRPASADANLQPTTAQGAFANPSARGHGLLNALLDIRAATSAGNSGPPGGNGAAQVLLGPESIVDGERLTASENNNSATRTAGAHTAHGSNIDAGANQLASRSLTDARELQVSNVTQEDAPRQTLGASQQQAAQSTMVINYSTPGMIGSLPILLTPEDEGGDDGRRSDAKRTLKASFIFGSAALGPVHVVLRQTGSAVSVGLWAELPEIAAELHEERGELFDALELNNIAVGALEIFCGAPPVSSPSQKPMEGSTE